MAGNRPVAVVTGASDGIGAAFARALAPTHDLVLVARREERLRALAAELAAPGRSVEVLPGDLSAEEGVARVEGRLRSDGRVALLVNNAGFGTRGAFFDAPLEGQERMHRLHVLATVRLCHAALSAMVPRGEGAIVNVSSVAAFWSAPGNASYCATKSWMNRFTEGLALDLAAARSPVVVQALCPGYTITGFHDVTGSDRGRVPSWLWMPPERVVEACLHGLSRRRLFVVPGRRYRFLAFLLRWMPGALRRRVAMETKGR